MKYSKNNKPLVCMHTESRCYDNTTEMTVKGVLWHSTGANNKTLKRYVQPSKSDPNYDELMKLIGKNAYGNSWNRQGLSVGVNAFIGELADGTVAAAQTLPWNYKPWGCASGKNGSCNNGWIQFEICEDGLSDPVYFNKVYQEACELTAYLCTLYNLDPNGTVMMNGVKVPVILCHADSHDLGLGSNHGDVMHWFPKHGKTMEDVRKDVAKLMKKPESTQQTHKFKVGDEVRLVTGAKYTSGVLIPKWVMNSQLYVRELQGDNVVISTLKTGDITGVVASKYLTKNSQATSSTAKPEANEAPVTFAVGEQVNLASDAKYTSGKPIPKWVLNSKLYVRELQGDNVVVSVLKVGPITGTVNKKYLVKQSAYKVKVTVDALNIRAGAGSNYGVVGCIRDHGVYTIVKEKNGWGQLGSGAGWISLQYTERV